MHRSGINNIIYIGASDKIYKNNLKGRELKNTKGSLFYYSMLIFQP